MTSSTTNYLLFDLGGTLMSAKQDWEPILARADQALVDTLAKSSIQLDAKVFRRRLHEYYKQRDKDQQETTYHLVLRELLEELDHVEIAETTIRSALDALFRVTQSNWQVEDDTIETIQHLKAEQYHLGIFSNAGDDKDVQELVEGFGIRSYFDFVLSSAGSFYRKPHLRAFEIALARWNITPEEAVMIGDSLEADIYGGKQAGMTTIWITRRAQFTEEDLRRIKPDFSIRKLRELLPTLERISLNHF